MINNNNYNIYVFITVIYKRLIKISIYNNNINVINTIIQKINQNKP